jgi:hypothetical protein
MLPSSTTNNNKRPVVVVSLDDDADSRGVEGVTLVGAVEKAEGRNVRGETHGYDPGAR